MSIENKIEKILDSIRKVAFYVGHGKYNDYMTSDEVLEIKATLEKILEIESKFEKAKTQEDKELIYKHLSIYETFTLKDFINYEVKEF